MACRNREKGEQAQKEIIKLTQNDQVYLKEVDLASFKSIRSFCADFKKQFTQLDMLIHNAAYFNHGENYREFFMLRAILLNTFSAQSRKLT